MGLVVEDGTGVLNANSYIEVAFADTYFADRLNSAWTGDNSAKEAYLIAATDYIETVFGKRFIGDRMFGVDYLSWPRRCAGPYLNTDIPTTLKKACAEYALRAISGPLMPDPQVDASGFATVVIKKVIGPIEKDFQVMGSGSRPPLVRAYPGADGLMRPLLCAGTGGTRVTR